MDPQTINRAADGERLATVCRGLAARAPGSHGPTQWAQVSGDVIEVQYSVESYQ